MAKDLLGIQGRVAIVTGASSGIGRGIAIELAEAGAHIVLAARRVGRLEQLARQLRKKRVRVLVVQTDVSDKAQVKQLVAQTIKHFRHIDILINNAGILEYEPFLHITDESWQRTLDVNLRGYLWVGQEVARQMKKRGRGVIVNIASIAAFGAFPQIASYNVSKAGIVMLTKNMAAELGVYGIRVNAIAPGMIATEMTAGMLKDKKRMKAMLAGVPLGRVGKSEDMAGVALFLASDLSSYVTGATVVADGGWMCHL